MTNLNSQNSSQSGSNFNRIRDADSKLGLKRQIIIFFKYFGIFLIVPIVGTLYSIIRIYYYLWKIYI